MSQYEIIAEPDGVLSANKDTVTYRLEGAEGKHIRWKANNGKRSQALYGLTDDVYGPEGKTSWSTRWQYPGQHEIVAEVRTNEGVFGDTWEVIATHSQKVRADLSWVNCYKIVSDPPIKSITPGANMTYRIERDVKGKQSGFPEPKDLRIKWFALNYADDEEKQLDLERGGTNVICKAKAKEIGHHRLMAEISHDGQRRLVVDYAQEVVSLEQVLKAGPVLPARKENASDPEVILRGSINYMEVMNKLETMTPPPANKKEAYEKEKEDKQAFIDKLKERLASTTGRPRYPVTASYYHSASSSHITLRVFASPMNDEGTEWMIVDWTAPNQRSATGEYSGTGKTPEVALKNAFESWDSGSRYPQPGGINYEFDHPNYNFKVKNYFKTDGETTLDSVMTILNWVSIGAAVVGGVITAIAPVPGSRIASAAIWSFVFAAGTGGTAGVINYGQRESEGFGNSKDTAFDALTILGSMLGAGIAVKFMKGAPLILQTGTKTTQVALVSLIGTDVAQGVLIGMDQLKAYDEITNDPKLSPDERLKKLLALFSSAAFTGGLVYFGVKGSKADLKNLSSKSNFIDPGMSPEAQLKKLGNPDQPPIIIRDKGVEGHTGKGNKHETVVQTNPAKVQSKFNQSQFDAIYSKAPAAKLEIDSMADEIADMYGGQVAKAPVKSQDRAIQKIMNDYGGDATRIKDLARNTIIVSPDKVDSVVGELSKRGANVKVIDGATDPMGYSGVNSTIKTESGLVGEVQVNTPAMIYAKESEPMARILLGDDMYNSIAAKSDMPGGQGHELYEQWRVLPKSDPGRPVIEAQSKSYYDAVRRSINGN